jgi:hypothetical protein
MIPKENLPLFGGEINCLVIPRDAITTVDMAYRDCSAGLEPGTWRPQGRRYIVHPNFWSLQHGIPRLLFPDIMAD